MNHISYIHVHKNLHKPKDSYSLSRVNKIRYLAQTLDIFHHENFGIETDYDAMRYHPMRLLVSDLTLNKSKQIVEHLVSFDIFAITSELIIQLNFRILALSVSYMIKVIVLYTTHT